MKYRYFNRNVSEKTLKKWGFEVGEYIDGLPVYRKYIASFPHNNPHKNYDSHFTCLYLEVTPDEANYFVLEGKSNGRFTCDCLDGVTPCDALAFSSTPKKAIKYAKEWAKNFFDDRP